MGLSFMYCIVKMVRYRSAELDVETKNGHILPLFSRVCVLCRPYIYAK